MWAVNVSLADVRRVPSSSDFYADIDPNQETQVLYNEAVEPDEPFEKKEGWIKIKAIEQPRFRDESGWTGYPGWVREQQICYQKERGDKDLVVTKPWANLTVKGEKIQVPLGTTFQKISKENGLWKVHLPCGNLGKIDELDAKELTPLSDIPLRIIETAKMLLGNRYTWGGLSPQGSVSSTFTSVDCSGLVHLSYRTQGIKIPRDADCQFRLCQEIKPKNLRAADLIFLFPVEGGRVNHVILYIGNDQFIDANISDKKVVMSSGQERFGIPFSQMDNGSEMRTKNKQYKIHFGRIQGTECLKV